MAAELLDRMKIRYFELLKSYAKKNKSRQTMLREKWVSSMTERVLLAKQSAKAVGETNLSMNASMLLRSYDVKVVNTKCHLMKKCKELFKPGHRETYRMVIPMEHSFEIVLKSHMETNHGNTNDMFDWLDDHSYTVASICLPILREICGSMNPDCSQKKKKPQRKITESPPENTYTVKNTVTVTFLDMSLQPDNSFRYLLVYEHLESRFIQLRPLTATDLIEETTMELMKIFYDFSPPKTLRALTATETLFKAVLERLNCIFAEKILLYTCDNIAVNTLIAAKLKHWMLTKESQCWSIGCHYVQWDINNTKSRDGCAFVKFFGRPESQLKKIRKPLTEPDATESSSKIESKTNKAKTKTKNDNSSMRNVTEIISDMNSINQNVVNACNVTDTPGQNCVVDINARSVPYLIHFQPTPVGPYVPMTYYPTNVNNLAYGLNNAQIFNLATPMGSATQNQPSDMYMIQQQQANDLSMAKLQQANNMAQNQQGNYMPMIPNHTNDLLIVKDQANNLFLLQNQAIDLSVFQNEPKNLSTDQNQQGNNLSIAQNQANNLYIAQNQSNNMTIAQIETDNLSILQRQSQANISSMTHQRNNLSMAQTQPKNLSRAKKQSNNKSIIKNRRHNSSMARNSQGNNLSIGENETNSLSIAQNLPNNLSIARNLPNNLSIAQNQSNDFTTVQNKANASSMDTETQVCCICELAIESNERSCCVCNKNLHLYCGARRQNPSGDQESVCFLCLTLF